MQGLATKSFALYAAEKGIKSNSKEDQMALPMEELKQVLPKEVIEVQQAIQQVVEPEPSPDYTADVALLFGGIVTLAVLYKLWLKYGKK